MTKEVLMTKFERTREHDDAFWLDGETLIVREEPGSKPVYDLEERTARFGEAVIASVGANYTEADDSVSKREFLKCIATCKKEARETKFFLRLSVRAVPKLKPEARELGMEAREFHLIFAKIWRSGKQGE